MTNTAKALYSFFSSFGLPAYVEDCVPDGAELPYITYQLVSPDWRDSALMYARVWYRSTSLVAINAKVDEISAAIGESKSIPTDGGTVYLSRHSDFSKIMPMEGDNTLKCMLLNIVINAITT